MTTNKIGWNIYKFLSSLLILLWLLAKLYLLSQDMQGLNVFGGGMILVWLFPILSIFLLLSKKLQKHILAIITIVIGFIIVNYLDYYLAVSQHEFSIFVMLFISMLPFLLIFPPYVWLLNFILKEPEKFEAQEDKKLIINIKTMDGILFLLPSIVLGVTIFMLFTFDIKPTVQTNAVFNFILIGFIFGCFASLLYRRIKFKTEHLYYIININDSIKPYPKKIINGIFAILICLLITSYLLESYRGNWLLWSGCSGLIFLISFNLWTVYKPMFLGIDRNIKPTKFKFPDITSKKNKIIIAILYTVICFWIIIIGKTLKTIHIF